MNLHYSSSIQASKLESTYQNVQLAMDELRIWVKQLDSDRDPRMENLLQTPNEMAANQRRFVKLVIRTKRLSEAEKWATEVFNDNKNCSADIRIKAFDIRLFCVTVMAWDGQSRWINKWQRLFEYLFADSVLVTKILQTQISFHRLVLGDNKPLRDYLLKMLRSVEDLINNQIAGKSTQFMSQAKEFMLNLQQGLRHAVLPKELQHLKTWAAQVKLKDYYLASTEYLQAIPFIHGHLWSFPHYGMTIDFTDAKTIYVINNVKDLALVNEDTLWGIDNYYELVSIETASPNQKKSLSKPLGEVYWKIYCAIEINRVYTVCDIYPFRYISVFDSTSGKFLNNLRMPPSRTHVSNLFCGD